MRTWEADLAGLVIGFALGGAVLTHFLPQIEAYLRPAVSGPPPAHPVQVATATPLPAVIVPRRPPPTDQPAQREDFPALMPAPAPMPQISEPDEADPAMPPPPHGSGVAGTGFFVADGLVMTAAHVVPGCQRTEIVSPFIRRSPVQVEARDTKHDIALLEAKGVRAPATLAIGQPTSSGEKVFVLGYPATAGLLNPEATWGVLENDKLPREPASMTDPRAQVWIEAGQVRHGYSGGPIFEPRSGKVVGIVRGTLDGSKLRAIRGMPTSGVTIGPGSALLGAFLENAVPGTNAFPADQWGDDPITVVRHATVHVLCWN